MATKKYATDLQRGDRIILDGDVVRVTSVRKYGANEVQVSFYFKGETERAMFLTTSRVELADK